MSRVRRASVAATFTYLQFALSIIVGIGMVPFVLSRVDVAVYGLWLATGEVLAYAAMADLGILGIVPWVVAQADGRGDRGEIRTVLANGACAAAVVSLAYMTIIAGLWWLAPESVLSAHERALIGGPLAVMAAVTAIVLPLRVASAALSGLQDVRFMGTVSTIAWFLDVVITATLLLKGYGLYALAIGASVPSALAVAASIARLHRVAPDLARSWPLPSRTGTARLLRDGFGGWLGAWGWRLSAATDGIVLGWVLGRPDAVTRLALTSKLGQTLMQVSWVPGDSGLVGLSQLSGEGRERLHAAVTAIFRMYLTLGTAAACVVLVANASFVAWWVPEGIFGGRVLTMLLAVALISLSLGHAFSTTVSVLGRRVTVGIVNLSAGVLQVGLAYFLARRYGLIGIPAAAIIGQLCLCFPLFLGPLADVSGVNRSAFFSEVLWRWARGSVPALVICGVAGAGLWTAPLWIMAPAAGLAAAAYLWLNRGMILDYPPVAALLRRPLTRIGLERLLPAPVPQEPLV